MKFHRVMASFLCVSGVAIGTGFPAAEPAPGTADTIVSVQLEISPTEATVRIQTSRPVPIFSCSLKGPEVMVTFPSASSRLQPEYQVPVSYLGPVLVEAPAGTSRGAVVLRLRPRSTALARMQLLDDGLALTFPAAGSDPKAGSEEYQIGVGDRLEIAVFGHEDLTRTVEVRADGTVNMPLLGDMVVEGKGVRELADEVTRRLSREFLVDPMVSVEVKDYRSHWVTLMGEIKSPGRYPLRRNMRLLDVLAEAGGPTKEAGRQIRVTSPASGDAPPQERIVQMADLLKSGEAGANVALRHGDVISVMDRELFYIRGEVNRPSAYVLESGMSLLKAVAIAGGLSAYANRKEVQLIRSSGPAAVQQRIDVNLKAIEEGRQEDIPLLPDDVIIVPRRIF